MSLLERAIESVRRQDWTNGKLNHLIIIDDCDETADWLKEKKHKSVTWRLARRGREDASGPSRLARLRNMAWELAGTDWVAFLDDDNEFEPQHIRTLLDCASNGCPAVHSYRKLFHFDGQPFLEQFWPWCREEGEAQQRYWKYVAKGILEPGSNVAREQAISADGCRESIHIDMNVWLLRRELVQKCAMSDQFTEEDWIANLAEDDKLLQALTQARIPIASSGVASVRYYLGGYSNDFERKHPHSEAWERPSL